MTLLTSADDRTQLITCYTAECIELELQLTADPQSCSAEYFGVNRFSQELFELDVVVNQEEETSDCEVVFEREDAFMANANLWLLIRLEEFVETTAVSTIENLIMDIDISKNDLNDSILRSLAFFDYKEATKNVLILRTHAHSSYTFLDLHLEPKSRKHEAFLRNSASLFYKDSVTVLEPKNGKAKIADVDIHFKNVESFDSAEKRVSQDEILRHNYSPYITRDIRLATRDIRLDLYLQPYHRNDSADFNGVLQEFREIWADISVAELEANDKPALDTLLQVDFGKEGEAACSDFVFFSRHKNLAIVDVDFENTFNHAQLGMIVFEFANYSIARNFTLLVCGAKTRCSEESEMPLMRLDPIQQFAKTLTEEIIGKIVRELETNSHDVFCEYDVVNEANADELIILFQVQNIYTSVGANFILVFENGLELAETPDFTTASPNDTCEIIQNSSLENTAHFSLIRLNADLSQLFENEETQITLENRYFKQYSLSAYSKQFTLLARHANLEAFDEVRECSKTKIYGHIKFFKSYDHQISRRNMLLYADILTEEIFLDLFLRNGEIEVLLDASEKAHACSVDLPCAAQNARENISLTQILLTNDLSREPKTQSTIAVLPQNKLERQIARIRFADSSVTVHKHFEKMASKLDCKFVQTPSNNNKRDIQINIALQILRISENFNLKYMEKNQATAIKVPHKVHYEDEAAVFLTNKTLLQDFYFHKTYDNASDLWTAPHCVSAFAEKNIVFREGDFSTTVEIEMAEDEATHIICGYFESEAAHLQIYKHKSECTDLNVYMQNENRDDAAINLPLSRIFETCNAEISVVHDEETNITVQDLMKRSFVETVDSAEQILQTITYDIELETEEEFEDLDCVALIPAYDSVSFSIGLRFVERSSNIAIEIDNDSDEASQIFRTLANAAQTARHLKCAKTQRNCFFERDSAIAQNASCTLKAKSFLAEVLKYELLDYHLNVTLQQNPRKLNSELVFKKLDAQTISLQISHQLSSRQVEVTLAKADEHEHKPIEFQHYPSDHQNISLNFVNAKIGLLLKLTNLENSHATEHTQFYAERKKQKLSIRFLISSSKMDRELASRKTSSLNSAIFIIPDFQLDTISRKVNFSVHNISTNFNMVTEEKLQKRDISLVNAEKIKLFNQVQLRNEAVQKNLLLEKPNENLNITIKLNTKMEQKANAKITWTHAFASMKRVLRNLEITECVDSNQPCSDFQVAQIHALFVVESLKWAGDLENDSTEQCNYVDSLQAFNDTTSVQRNFKFAHSQTSSVINLTNEHESRDALIIRQLTPNLKIEKCTHFQTAECTRTFILENSHDQLSTESSKPIAANYAIAESLLFAFSKVGLASSLRNIDYSHSVHFKNNDFDFKNVQRSLKFGHECVKVLCAFSKESDEATSAFIIQIPCWDDTVMNAMFVHSAAEYDLDIETVENPENADHTVIIKDSKAVSRIVHQQNHRTALDASFEDSEECETCETCRLLTERFALSKQLTLTYAKTRLRSSFKNLEYNHFSKITHLFAENESATTKIVTHNEQRHTIADFTNFESAHEAAIILPQISKNAIKCKVTFIFCKQDVNVDVFAAESFEAAKVQVPFKEKLHVCKNHECTFTSKFLNQWIRKTANSKEIAKTLVACMHEHETKAIAFTIQQQLHQIDIQNIESEQHADIKYAIPFSVKDMHDIYFEVETISVNVHKFSDEQEYGTTKLIGGERAFLRLEIKNAEFSFTFPRRMTAATAYEWRTETTRTTTQPNGATWRTETVVTNQQQQPQPQSHSATWRTESSAGGPPVTTQRSWHEKRTNVTTTVERQAGPTQQEQRSYETRHASRTLERDGGSTVGRPDSAASFQYARGDRLNPGEQRLSQLTRPDSRASVTASDHGSVVNDTLQALATDVKETTEIIRRKQQQYLAERRQFQTEMEVTGRMSISPTDDWLNTRLKAVSTDDLKKDLGRIKDDQRTNAVTDTLAALVYDVNATAEVLRRGSLGRDRDAKKKQQKEEVEYRLRVTPSVDEEPKPFPSPKPYEHVPDEKTTVDDMNREFGVDLSETQTSSLRRRARSETPRRTLQIAPSPPPAPLPVCAYCNEEIDGQILTALAPNSERAQKFHTYHFMCTYCQKALNMHGTYREHDRKPYCHDCFYKLYNGLQYCPDEHQAQIEKLI